MVATLKYTFHAITLVGILTVTSANAEESSSTVGEAIVMIDVGRYEEAERLLALIKGDEPRAVVLYCLARLAEIHGDLETALSRSAEAITVRRNELTSVTSLDGANALAKYHTDYGKLALRYGEVDRAETQFRAAIKLVNDAHQRLHTLGVPHEEGDPRLIASAATDGLARVYATRGDARRAVRTWRSVAGRTKDPAILIRFGNFYTSIGEERQAQRMYARAATLADERPEHCRIIALHLANQGTDLDRALNLAQTALEGNDDIESHDVLAWVLHCQGKHDRAAEAITKALRTGTRDPRILFHAGSIFHALARLDEAREHLQNALKINPNFDPLDAKRAREVLDSLD